ncbi:MAG: tetratricopeptide repeat protein [Longimicrobiales bacterium]
MWYGTRDVARLLGLSESQVRSWVRAGLLEVERGARNSYRFSFQDLVLLRTARGLIDANVPHPRIVRALRRLKAQLPVDRNLSELRIAVDGDDVVVSDGGAPWNPESGQLHLEFAVAELTTGVAPLYAVPRLHGETERPTREDSRTLTEGSSTEASSTEGSAELTADDWFARGVELELTAPADARDAYEQSLILDAGHADAHVNLGRMLHEARRHAEAEVHYRAALADGPHATAAYNLGIVLEDRRCAREAVAAYRVALEADPGMADAHYNLARLYEQLGDETAALRHLKSYRSLTQGSGRA